MVKRFGNIHKLMITSLILPYSGQAEVISTELPPPPRYHHTAGERVYYLELILNQQPSGVIARVLQRDGEFWIENHYLQQTNFPSTLLTYTETNLTAIDDVTVNYDSDNQQLNITVPADWLPRQLLSSGKSRPYIVGKSGRGAIFNYDLYATYPSGQSVSTSLWNELRLFSEYGWLSHTGIVRNFVDSTDNSHRTTQYTRYDTRYTWVNEENAIRFSVGDVITNALSWGNSVRLGGFTLDRDFSIRPDIITYPLPQFSGSAAVPGTADLFINGYKDSSLSLSPGPFTLTNTPYINGAGEAVLVTTDAMGRKVSTTMPFYVASTLLRPGLSEGSISAGVLRQEYGNRSGTYGEGSASFSGQYGVTNYWTVEGHAQSAKNLTMAGIGSVVKVGHLGVIQGSWSQSHMAGHAGSQYTAGYQYTRSGWSIATQQTRRDQHFGNLALYDARFSSGMYQPEVTLSRRSAQYNASLSLGGAGSLGAAWIEVENFAGDETRLLNLSWSKSLWRGSNLYLSANHDPDKSGWSGALSLQIPINSLNAISLSGNRSANGQQIQEVSYNRAMPTDGGLSWNFAYAHQSPQQDYQQASLSWQNNHIQLRGGSYGTTDSHTRWGEVSGSLVIMDNTALMANKIHDAFAVISTEGYPDVEVTYEHQPIGKTNSRGYLLVPNVPAWYSANYAINTRNLPASARTGITEKNVAIRRHSGYKVSLPVRIERASSVLLVDQNNVPLPLSSIIKREGQPDTYIGWDGLAWLENIHDKEHLLIRTPDNHRCEITIHLPEKPLIQSTVPGPFRCVLVSDSRTKHE